MSDEPPDPEKVAGAKKATMLFMTQMLSLQGDVKLMTAELLAKTLFVTEVKEEHRLDLFDRWSKSIRADISKSVKTPARKKR